MLTQNDAQSAMGSTLYGSDGEKIGKIAQVYLSDTSGEPEFLTVNTGFFGSNESFVPAGEASINDDGVTVPYTKDKVKDAPNVAADGHLEPHEEDSLYEYYGMGTGQSVATDTTDSTETTDGTYRSDATDSIGSVRDSGITGESYATDTEGRSGLTGTDGAEGYDTSGPTTDDAMTRSEEQLNVGTRTQESGRARLRKYVTTEEQTVTVPVSKEYAVLETEPITEDNAGSALSGGDITEEEHEVLLNEEVVVVEKTVNPVERVRIGTETRTEDQTVTEEVRQENIEVDGDVEGADRRA